MLKKFINIETSLYDPVLLDKSLGIYLECSENYDVHIDDIGKRQLVGISCFMANSFHGYQCDVHLRTCLSCSFSFMSPTHAVVCDAAFLHALSDESVETYTSRSLQVNMTHADP